jgi:hypothetical protein
VMLRARWVMLRARWVMLRARWVMLRARWVMLRARWVSAELSAKYTGAKTAGGAWGSERGEVQALGCCRTKPGRSDVPAPRRTLSMSCTDKVRPTADGEAGPTA